MLEYMLKNGPERFAEEARDRTYLLKSLQSFNWSEEGRDKGAGSKYTQAIHVCMSACISACMSACMHTCMHACTPLLSLCCRSLFSLLLWCMLDLFAEVVTC